MLHRLSTALRLQLEALVRRGAQDGFMLRWAILSFGVLAGIVALQACRAFRFLDEAQLVVLAGHPFYLSAQDAQVSLLSPAGQFGLCVVVTLYFGGVLMMQKRLGRRSHICLLAAVVFALPGLLCVLWHGVLYVGQALTCILLLWVILVPVSACFRHHRS